jgi:hypothetical protein
VGVDQLDVLIAEEPLQPPGTFEVNAGFPIQNLDLVPIRL